MATAKCGWCGANTHVTERGNGVIHAHKAGLPEGLPTVQGAFSCDQCGRYIVGSYRGSEIPSTIGPDGMAAFWYRAQPQLFSPAFVEGQAFKDVPNHIASAAGEAFKGSSIGNHMSAILMARTVIEASAKEKGITRGSLLGKIDELANLSLIREDTKEAAHAIREFGNDMAHGDISDPVGADDAEEVLVLMTEVLNELFQGPARVEAIKAKVAARKAQAQVK